MTDDQYKEKMRWVDANGGRNPAEPPGDEPGLTVARIACVAVLGLLCWGAIWLLVSHI